MRTLLCCGLVSLIMAVAGHIHAVAAEQVLPPPNNADNFLVSAMLIRGAGDFAGLHGRWAADETELASQGFLSYLLPEETHLTYHLIEGGSVVTSEGFPIFSGRQELPPLEHCMTKLLGTSKLVSTTNAQALAEHHFGLEAAQRIPAQQRVYYFYGAEWLEQGKDRELVADAMRFERIRVHYAFATLEFQRYYSRMPVDVSELDAFIGLERNPNAWESVAFVANHQQLSEQVGNFFVGWEGADFVVAVNNGIKLEESRYTKRASGRYFGAENLEY